jgi:hypothetical protein
METEMPFGLGKKNEQASRITDNSLLPLNDDDHKDILRDPYMWGIKENIIDIPYDVITSVKLEKRLFTSVIGFEAPALVGSRKLGMIKGMVKGERCATADA